MTTIDSEFLTVGDVAANFGWTPRFVERLAVLGAIPGTEVNSQWHFRRDDLVEWLDRKIQTLDTTKIADLESTLEAELQAASRNVRIAERLSPATVSLDSSASGKPAVLKELSALAERTSLVIDGTALLASIAEREAIVSTAMPGGFAICHPRRPLPQALRRTLITALRTSRPIAFGAPDDERTQFFFLIAAIDDRAHLYALARLVRIVQGGTLDALFEAESAEDFVEIIRSREDQIDGASTRGN